jgi:hypothetical protein
MEAELAGTVVAALRPFPALSISGLPSSSSRSGLVTSRAASSTAWGARRQEMDAAFLFEFPNGAQLRSVRAGTDALESVPIGPRYGTRNSPQGDRRRQEAEAFRRAEKNADSSE